MEICTVKAGESFLVGDQLVTFVAPVGLSGDGIFDIGDGDERRLATGQWQFVRQPSGSLRYFKICRRARRSRMKVGIIEPNDTPESIGQKERSERMDSWQAWKQVERSQSAQQELAAA